MVAEEQREGGTPLSEKRIDRALKRLSKSWALHTLVRGALPTATLRRLLKGAFTERELRELPAEALAGIVASIALEDADFGDVVCDELHDRLGWDREPEDLEDWWEPVRERPLEALWMAALSSSRSVAREFDHILGHCLENHRSSPDCAPPSWDFVEGNLEIHAQTAQALREAERRAQDAERRFEVERQRLDELREELRRLRRENADLRRENAQRRRALDAARAEEPPDAPDAGTDVERLELALRKADKEREHLRRELERSRATAEAGTGGDSAPEIVTEAAADTETDPAPNVPGAKDGPPPASRDPKPRRRLLRQMLRRLSHKGKIGGAHTHQDNVFRGIADHDKGTAKRIIDLLYKEGVLVAKPTIADPHVSINAERMDEVREMIAGRIANPRLRRYVEQSDG